MCLVSSLKKAWIPPALVPIWKFLQPKHEALKYSFNQPMVNVYESVAANRRKSLLVITSFIAFILLAAYFIARGFAAYYGYESTGLEFTGIALVISGFMSFISYYFSDRIILGLSGARP